MKGQPQSQPLVGMTPAMLGLLMPFHLLIAADGRIRSVGPTLEKLLPGGFVGARFLDIFELKRPRGMFTLAQLAVVASQRLQLLLRAGDITTTFHGQAMLLPAGQGAIINLGLGVGLAETVAGHGLTHADFAPTDLSVEMLYLAEAKSAVADEMAELNRRLRRARAEAEDQAQTDALTGLRNRRALDAAMARTTADNGIFALMHMDLDFFKEVNDSLGHAAGDHVLQHMARILREETRTGDVLARVGGDEFVVMLDGVRAQARVDAVAGRILRRLAEPILFEGQPCRVSASIGTTLSLNYSSCEAEQMHADADSALYASKRAGRCRATAWSPEWAKLSAETALSTDRADRREAFDPSQPLLGTGAVPFAGAEAATPEPATPEPTRTPAALPGEPDEMPLQDAAPELCGDPDAAPVAGPVVPPVFGALMSDVPDAALTGRPVGRATGSGVQQASP